jgi:hypothetical protein
MKKKTIAKITVLVLASPVIIGTTQAAVAGTVEELPVSIMAENTEKDMINIFKKKANERAIKAVKEEHKKEHKKKSTKSKSKTVHKGKVKQVQAPSYSTETGVRGVVQSVADQYGWGSGYEWEAIDAIVNQESTWNPTAQNSCSTAHGLFQMLVETSNDPYTQAVNGMRYISERYGSPSNAWAFHLQNGWY